MRVPAGAPRGPSRPPAVPRPAALRPAALRPAVAARTGAGATPGAGGFVAAQARAGEATGADPLEALLAALVAPDSPGPGAPGGGGAGIVPEPGTDRRGGAGGTGSPFLARAVERVALLVNAGAAPAVTVQLGRSAEVRVAQAEGGVEVTIRAARGLSPLAEAELPFLVAALRARGVRVARAGVWGRRGGGHPSLTARRSSATRHGDDGSVAKW